MMGFCVDVVLECLGLLKMLLELKMIDGEFVDV